jgi:LacI family kdg operon repressor
VSVEDDVVVQGTVRRPTLQDIAVATGVSVMTVSRALNGQDRVSEETRLRVVAEAERLGYRPSHTARALRVNESRLIGFLAPNLMLPVHVEIIQGARDVAAQEGYRLLLQVDIPGDQPGNPFISDGDLVIANTTDSPRMKHYTDPMRTVGLMSRTTTPGIDICGSDLLRASLEAFQHLLQAGYRRIGLIQHIGNTPRFGREEALAAAGIEDDPDLVQVVENDKESVLRGLHALMALPNRPDAIAVVHVAGTPVVLRELQLHRFMIGRDIGFIGTEVSTSDWGDLISPRMTSIRIPGYRIGAAGAERLIARLRGDRSPARRYEYPAELVVRESTPGPWSPGLPG